jgi:hypothetical protein
MSAVKHSALFASISAALGAVAIFLIFYPPLFDQPAPQDVSGQSVGPQLNTQIAGVRFDKATNLTNNTQDSVYGQVVAAADNAYVVWQDSVSSSESTDGRYIGRNYDIFMMTSIDGGDSFGPPINLSTNSGFSEHPQSASYGESVYVVWADDTSGNKEVLFVAAKNNGSDLGTIVNLSNSNSDSYNQEIAVFEGDVYAVWLEEGEKNSRVMFRASHDRGKTFDESLVISEKANVGTLPKISADGHGVHVAWSLLHDESENGLFYSASLDGGKNFNEAKKLSKQNNFGEPQIISSNETVYVISGGMDTLEVNGLLIAMSLDGGVTFSSETINVNGSFVNPLNVEAAVDGSMLFVAGQVLVGSNDEILLLQLETQPDSAKALGLVNLSGNPKISECPSIAIAGDRIFVVWEDLSPGNHEILYAKGQKI